MDEAIRIDRLSFSYPDGQQALSEISLSIDKGESVGIVGPNGAGKSTLLLHLNGILRSDNGAVKVLGQPVDDKNLLCPQPECTSCRIKGHISRAHNCYPFA